MKVVWKKEKQEMNSRLAFQMFCEKADRIVLVASDFYQIRVNERFLGYGPAKAAEGFARKDVYDLSEYENFYITIEVLSYNIPSYSIFSGTPFFGAELYLGEKPVAGTDDFTAYEVEDYQRVVQKYSFQRGFSENYVMQEDRRNFYRGKGSFSETAVEEVSCPKLLDRKVAYPVYFSSTATQIESGRVRTDKSLPHWYEEWQMNDNPKLNKCFDRGEIAEFVSDTVSEFVYEKGEQKKEGLKENEYALYDFGRIVVGFFKLELTVEEDCELYLSWSEIAKETQAGYEMDFSRNSCCDILKYQLKKGRYELLSFEPYCARYARLIVKSGKITEGTLGLLHLENANKNRLQFRCANKNLEKIVEAAQNTLAHNALDIYMDCPGRERAGWLCDSFFMGKAEKLLFGNNRVERNFLENYVLAEKFEGYPKGMIPMCYPSKVRSRKYIPNWALWFILEMRDYLDRTGDESLVLAAKERIFGVLEYFKAFENGEGLLENLTSWVFVEWSKSNEFTNGINYPTNMLYCAALRCAGELYDEKPLLQKSADLKEKIIRLSFNGTFFEDNGVRDEAGTLRRTGNVTETCQYYALFLDVAEGEAFADLEKRMISEFGYYRNAETTYPHVYKSNAFIGNYLRLAYLLKRGYYQRLLKECEEYFLYMAEQTQTLWEHSMDSNSLDHGFASYAACLIVEALEKSQSVDYEIVVQDDKE